MGATASPNNSPAITQSISTAPKLPTVVGGSNSGGTDNNSGGTDNNSGGTDNVQGTKYGKGRSDGSGYSRDDRNPFKSRKPEPCPTKPCRTEKPKPCQKRPCPPPVHRHHKKCDIRKNVT